MATRSQTQATNPASSTPEIFTQATGGTHPYLPVLPPFVYVYNPNRWMVQDGVLVPDMHRCPLLAGVNNVEQTRDGKFKLADLRARLETEGRTLIPFNWGPDGQSYLQQIETRPNGSSNEVAQTWLSVFESGKPGKNMIFSDERGYVEWVTGLIKSNKISPCPMHVAEQLHDALKKRLAEARAGAAKLGGQGRPLLRAEAIESDFKVVDEYIRKHTPARVRGEKKTPDLEA